MRQRNNNNNTIILLQPIEFKYFFKTKKKKIKTRAENVFVFSRSGAR